MTGDGWDAVLFDLDGTLADTVPLILESYRHTMREHLGEVMPDDAWLTGIGRPLSDQLAHFARSDVEAAAMLATYVSFQHTIHDRMARAYPRVLDVVAELERRGHALAIVTSKRSGIARRTLECCGLLPFFEVVVCSDHVTNGKPHPESVERAVALLGVREPGRVLFVGDSPFDLEAGRRGGVRTAAALWGPHDESTLRAARPDYLIRDVKGVLDLM